MLGDRFLNSIGMLLLSPCKARSALAAAVLLLLALPASSAPSAPASPFTRLPETAALAAGDRARLVAGEVLAHLEPRRGPGPREGVGIGVVEAPPERVFRALADWGHWEEFMPFLERSAAAPQPDGSVLVDQALDLPAPLGERRFRVRGRARVEGSGAGRVWRLSWAALPGSGNLAAHRGSWALVELAPGRTLAVCRLLTDPGGVSAWAADRATSKSLPWVFDGLRQHVRRSRYDERPAGRDAGLPKRGPAG
jgi:polyketide cyclase/dehydrase/lipid transport protein